MHHGRPPQRHMEPAYSTPVLHLQFISLQVSEQQLFNIFTLYGNVVKIMFLDPGHNGKRTSLLEMGSIRQANNAQIYLDGFTLYRSSITIKAAKKLKIETGLGREAYQGLPEKLRRPGEWLNFPPTRRLRVTGLPPDVTIDDLRVFFQRYNPTNVQLNNNNTNDCEVDFEDVPTAILALSSLHGTKITAKSCVTITFRQD